MKKIINNPIILLFILIFGIGLGYYLADNSDQKVESHDDQKHTTWTCSMDPQVQASEPGACPICGMDLIPATESNGSTIAPDEVKLSPRSLALAQIQTTEVKPLSGAGAQRKLIGRITQNEDQTKVITAWFGGRIEKLKVASVGENVKRYQTIAYVYSPAIYAAHRDLMTAQSQILKLSNADAFAQKASVAALESAKMRLRLLGLRSSEVDKMAKAEKAWTRVPIRSPFSGTVVQKRVSEGAYVKEGDALLEISNLSSVWVELDAYASDLPLIRVGQSVSFTVDSIPNQNFEGIISFIEPFVDSATRTGTVRVELENDGKLKPGQYVTATLEGTAFESETLVIPRSAPLYAGKRSVVYLEKQKIPEPIYVAKTIKLGQVIGDQVIVLKGLKEGDKVVSYGAFSLDADLQIRGGLSLLARPDDRSEVAELEVSDRFRESIAPGLEAYLRVQESLALDDLKSTQTTSAALLGEISKIDSKSLNAATLKSWDRLQSHLFSAATKISEAKDLKNSRTEFENLSNSMRDILTAVGNPLNTPVSYTFCPMAFDNMGAHWIQVGTDVRNPYYGTSMLACGSVEQVLVPKQKIGEEFAPKPVKANPSETNLSKTKKPKMPKGQAEKKAKKKPSNKPNSQPGTQPSSGPTSQPGTQPSSSPTSQPKSTKGSK